MEISIEQLEQLLNEQKRLCKLRFEREWKESDIYQELKKLDPEEKILNTMYEVRDRITGAEYPDDFNVLKKYKI